MNRRPCRAGFTLVELLVVAVLGSLIVVAAHKVMVNNTRAFTVVAARVQSQQTVRASADILFSELREISPSGGDLISIGQDSVVIRSMRTFGVACAVNPATPSITVRRVGRWLESGDSVFVLADNREDRASDDVWLSALVGTVDTTITCASGDRAQRITLPGMTSAMTTDTVRSGAPVRAFTRFWYGLDELAGEWYLARRGVDGVTEPMVGPLEPRGSGGLRLAYFDAMGLATTVPADVAQIRVTLLSASSVTTPAGEVVADSLVASVYPRN